MWFSSHVAHGLQEGVSLTLSCQLGDVLAHAVMRSLAHEHETKWPWQMHDPWLCGLHTQAPGGSLRWTAARNKISTGMGTTPA